MNDTVWNSLDRYFCGEASPEEVDAIEHADPKLVRDAQVVWNVAAAVKVRGSEEAAREELAWSALTRRVDAELVNEKLREPKPVAERSMHVKPLSGLQRSNPKRATVLPWISAAAALVLAFGVGRWYVQERLHQSHQNPAGAERVFSTRKAQRADMYLSDGTHVILNVDSRLHVPVTYGQGARTVSLEGEAFFDVVHDSTRPFKVLTKAGVAEDIGTSFVVSSYAEDRGIRVAVTSGEVALRRDSSAARVAHLKRGEAGVIDGSGNVAVRRSINIENELAWTTGRLVFTRTPLREALPKMSRWFDVEIALGDSALASRSITVSFKNQSVADVLELLPETFDARVQRMANAYVLYPTKRAHKAR